MLTTIYMFFVVFPYVFREVYHFRPLDQCLGFIGLILGIFLPAFLLHPYYRSGTAV